MKQILKLHHALVMNQLGRLKKTRPTAFPLGRWD